MRTFVDREGRTWEVVVGRESWGAIFAIFLPRAPSTDAGLRQTMLDADNYQEANREMDSLDDDGLRHLLDRSDLKDMGGAT